LSEISAAINPTTRESTLDDATGFIIPILLDKGLLAPSHEGRGFSLGLLLRIVKTSKSSLKDHLIRLISVLVESMSAMEPRTLQYMEFHVERLQISNSDLESTRLRLSQQSPLQDALDVCLESLVSPASLPLVADIILNLTMQTQQGVGLATRVAAVRSLVFIMNSCPDAWKRSIVQRCFQSILSSLVPAAPPSQSLRRELISAIGVLSKISEGTFLAGAITHLIGVYQNSGHHDEILVLVVAECLRQIISKGGELIQEETAMWNMLICCSFIGSFEEVSI
jgi:hypothetical protein